MKLIILLIFCYFLTIKSNSQSIYDFLENNPKSLVVVQYKSDSWEGRFITNYSILRRYLLSYDTSLNEKPVLLQKILDSLFKRQKILDIGFNQLASYWIDQESGNEDIRLISKNSLLSKSTIDLKIILMEVGVKGNKSQRNEFNYHSKFPYSKELIEYLFIHKIFVIEGDGHIYLFDLRKFPGDRFCQED